MTVGPMPETMLQPIRQEQKTGEVQSGYDRVAEEYARHLYDELRHKPLDCQLLDRFANMVRGKGLVCDLGCGPGQVARYLHDKKVEVCGVDLSAGMIEQARETKSGHRISAKATCWLCLCQTERRAGIAGFYAIVNFPPADLAAVMREIRRVLRPGGSVLLSFHIGEQIEHVSDLWGCAVSLDFYFFGVARVTAELLAAGFEIDEIIERGPYAPEVEYRSRRAYVFARKPMRK